MRSSQIPSLCFSLWCLLHLLFMSGQNINDRLAMLEALNQGRDDMLLKGRDDRNRSELAEVAGATQQSRTPSRAENDGSSARSFSGAAAQKDSDDCRDEDQDRSRERSREWSSSFSSVEDGESKLDLRTSRSAPPTFWGHADCP